MDDKQLTAGLSLLADELTDPDVDIDAAIGAARLRAHYRQSVAATAAATVLVIAAITTFVATTDRGGDTVGSPPSCAPTSIQLDTTEQTATTVPPQFRTSTPCRPTDGEFPYMVDWKENEQTANLTDQLAAARANLIPSSLRVDRDDSVNTRYIRGGPPPALVFGTASSDDDAYVVAFAKLTDQQGSGFLEIAVNNGEHSTASVPFQPCPTDGPTCTSKQFADGTTATWHSNIGDTRGWTQYMGAVRPDGTTIVVTISVWPGNGPAPSRPQVPLTPDQLYQFATVFTY
jgi:hypothetical protein